MRNFKVIQCMQGSDEWYQARLGKITASNFAKIVTKTGRISASHEEVINRAVAEAIIGEPEMTFQSDSMIRGQSLEYEALEFFNFTHNYNFEKCGFVEQLDAEDNPTGAGCSPDGLQGNELGLELKCPEAHTHLAYLAAEKLPDKYMAQVQGSLWITGLDKWVFGSYHPNLPSFCVEVLPDEEMFKAFQKHIPYCCKIVKERVEILRKKIEVQNDT